MNTTFHYTCECGCALPIAASSAGMVVPCRCGKQVKVPKLSELKRLSGQHVEPIVGIADQLRTMYLDKQLPPDTHCVCCQTKTTETLDCWVECERTYDRNGKGWAMAILFVWSLPLFLLARAFNRGSAHEVDGRELIVRTPLPICEKCLDTTSRNSANIRQLLLRVELYRRLLEKYPHAHVGAN
ncbi:MAG: hypothetical protein K8R36_02065 [Planctomycetales bacterium]|nr:hypothetical protein [Planctomycetales bacterium]